MYYNAIFAITALQTDILTLVINSTTPSVPLGLGESFAFRPPDVVVDPELREPPEGERAADLPAEGVVNEGLTAQPVAGGLEAGHGDALPAGQDAEVGESGSGGRGGEGQRQAGREQRV